LKRDIGAYPGFNSRQGGVDSNHNGNMKFVALATGTVVFRDRTQSTFVQAGEQTYWSLPSTLLLTNKRLTRPPEHISSRQEMTASANFHQLRDVIE
jgi:hypothetical protein